MWIKWKTLLAKLLVFLTVEVLFNVAGVDHLATYSEFIFDHRNALLLENVMG
jgi:hypothetical protein